MTSRDALIILKEDHDRIRALLHAYESLHVKGEDGVRERRLRQEIVRDILEHKYLEERIFYPIAAERLDGMKDFVMESLEEHHLMSLLLAEVQDLASDDERVHPKMMVLADIALRHGDREEEALFPRFRCEIGSEELSGLAAEIEAARAHAPRSALMEQPTQPSAVSLENRDRT